MGSLDGRTALITGGSSGIGKACAVRFRSEGATVFVADIRPQSSDELQLDVGDSAAWPALIASLPPLDIVMLNAGIVTPRRRSETPGSDNFFGSPLSIADITDEAYRSAMSVNLDGVFFGARAVIPGMVERGSGDVLMTASLAGLSAMPMDPIYGTNKHAVVGLSRALGASLAGTGVCVSALCPGFMDTPLVTADMQATIKSVGLPVASAERVADGAMASLQQRVDGAQWVMWGDEPPRIYQWTPGVVL